MTELPFRPALEPPFLIVRFEKPQRTLGWSITKPGFASATEVVWLEVRDDDLAVHVDPVEFVTAKLSSRGLAGAAAFLTSREIRRHHLAQSRIGVVTVTCLTTVGLSNGEKVGKRHRRRTSAMGTVNTLVHVSRPLSDGAFVETVSIATQARTAAIVETNDLRDGPAISGTGTDCVLVAAPEGDAPETCAGLHTDLGEAIGAAVYDATYAGAAEWSAELKPANAIQSPWRAT
ncbi:adenosylcobinamide amidohydrolase [Methylocystis sp. JAN1]|uniref:adenosylcobinamide amidohydrolase n=1 Tax=Methylocystis sp. JAN1 TaxID=3397211 RepID=UPI003FA1F1ED